MKKIALIFFSLIMLVACNETKKVTPKEVTKINNEQMKEVPHLYKNEDKKVEKFQNIEIRLALHDIEEILQDFCMNNKKAPSLSEIKKMLDDDHMQYENVPRTDYKGVEQLTFKDIEFKSTKLKYFKEDFECKGSLDISIKKLNWDYKATIPQGLTSFQLHQLRNEGHSQ